MVLMESLAGTGHKLIRIRPKTDDKLEFLYKDPWGKLFDFLSQWCALRKHAHVIFRFFLSCKN